MATPTKVSTFVFMDFEATGLPSTGDHPHATELGLVAVSRESLLQPFVYVPRVQDKMLLCINPCKVISPSASTLTGLFNDNLETQGPWNDDLVITVSGFFRRLRQPVCLLAHHGFGYDYKLLAAEMKRTNTQLPNDILCADTLVIFRELDVQGILPIYISPQKQAFQTPQMMIIKKQDPPPAPKKKPVQLKPDPVTKSHITNAKRKIFSDNDQLASPSYDSMAKSLCTDRVINQNVCHSDSSLDTGIPMSSLNVSKKESTRRNLFPEMNKTASSSLSGCAPLSMATGDDELEPMPDDCSIFSNETILEWESDFSEDEADSSQSQSVVQGPVKSQTTSALNSNNPSMQGGLNLCNSTKSIMHLSNRLRDDLCVASTSAASIASRPDFDDWDESMSDSELLAEVVAMELVLSEQSTNLDHKQLALISKRSPDSLTNRKHETKLSAVDQFSNLNKSGPLTSSDSLPGSAIHKTPQKNMKNANDSTLQSHNLTASNMPKFKEYNSGSNNNITCTAAKSSLPLGIAGHNGARPSADVGRFSPAICSSNSPNCSTSRSSCFVKQSYKLSEIYKRIFGVLPEVSHTAEDDCNALLAVSKCYGAEFCDIVDRTAILLSDVQPFV